MQVGKNNGFIENKKIEKKIKMSLNLDRVQVIKKNKRFFQLLHVFYEMIAGKEERILFFIMEQNKKNVDVYSNMISKRFFWSDTTTKRYIDSLVSKKYIEKVNTCGKCGKQYQRIPRICQCHNVLIRQLESENNNLIHPHFLTKIVQKGKKLVNIRMNDYYEALKQYSGLSN